MGAANTETTNVTTERAAMPLSLSWLAVLALLTAVAPLVHRCVPADVRGHRRGVSQHRVRNPTDVDDVHGRPFSRAARDRPASRTVMPRRPAASAPSALLRRVIASAWCRTRCWRCLEDSEVRRATPFTPT